MLVYDGFGAHCRIVFTKDPNGEKKGTGGGRKEGRGEGHVGGGTGEGKEGGREGGKGGCPLAFHGGGGELCSL